LVLLKCNMDFPVNGVNYCFKLGHYLH
jgi:hypothetical protein